MRDGLYIQTPRSGTLRGNVARDLRYGLHYMFSDDNLFEDNTFENGAAGTAIMYSRRIIFRRNRFLHNRGFASVGLLFKACDDVLAEDNLIADNARGIFLEGSYRIIVPRATSSPAPTSPSCSTTPDGGNRFEGNSFVGNLTPLDLVGRRTDTVFDGNYWSDNDEPDLDGDGRSDRPYRLSSVFDHFRGNLTAADLLSDSLAARRARRRRARLPGARLGARRGPRPARPAPALASGAAAGAALGGAATRAGSPSSVALAAGGRRGARRAAAAPMISLPRASPSASARSAAVDALTLDVARGEVVRCSGRTARARRRRSRPPPGSSGRPRARCCSATRRGRRRTRRPATCSPTCRRRSRFPDALTGARGGRVLPRAARRAAGARSTRCCASPRSTARARAAVGTYSGGMVQRLGLAVAMLPDAPVLLLDEPTAALDPDGLCAFYGLVEHAREDGRTVLFTSHQLGDVERLADRFAVLVGGRLVAQPHAPRADGPPGRARRACACAWRARPPNGCSRRVRALAPLGDVGRRRAGRARARGPAPARCSTRCASSASRSAALTAEEGRLDVLYRELVAEADAHGAQQGEIEELRRRRQFARPALAARRPARRGLRRPRARARRARHAQRACAFCRMTVSDARFAAQLVAPGEEPRFFDDLGCLRDFLRAGQAAGRAPSASSPTTGPGRGSAPTRAVYTRVAGLETPMGSHLIAHADAASRDAGSRRARRHARDGRASCSGRPAPPGAAHGERCLRLVRARGAGARAALALDADLRRRVRRCWPRGGRLGLRALGRPRRPGLRAHRGLAGAARAAARAADRAADRRAVAVPGPRRGGAAVLAAGRRAARSCSASCSACSRRWPRRRRSASARRASSSSRSPAARALGASCSLVARLAA